MQLRRHISLRIVLWKSLAVHTILWAMRLARADSATAEATIPEASFGHKHGALPTLPDDSPAKLTSENRTREKIQLDMLVNPEKNISSSRHVQARARASHASYPSSAQVPKKRPSRSEFSISLTSLSRAGVGNSIRTSTGSNRRRMLSKNAINNDKSVTPPSNTASDTQPKKYKPKQYKPKNDRVKARIKAGGFSPAQSSPDAMREPGYLNQFPSNFPVRNGKLFRLHQGRDYVTNATRAGTRHARVATRDVQSAVTGGDDILRRLRHPLEIKQETASKKQHKISEIAVKSQKHGITRHFKRVKSSPVNNHRELSIARKKYVLENPPAEKTDSGPSSISRSIEDRNNSPHPLRPRHIIAVMPGNYGTHRKRNPGLTEYNTKVPLSPKEFNPTPTLPPYDPLQLHKELHESPFEKNFPYPQTPYRKRIHRKPKRQRETMIDMIMEDMRHDMQAPAQLCRTTAVCPFTPSWLENILMQGIVRILLN